MILQTIHNLLQGMAKFTDLNYVIQFSKDNALLILLFTLWAIKTYSNVVTPITEVEGSLVQSIKTMDDWNSKVEKSMAEGKLVVCDFYANWCPPCRTASPIFAEMSIAYKGKPIVFWKVNVDDVPAVASNQNVSSLPLFRIFGKGVGSAGNPTMVELKSQVGWAGHEKFKTFLDEQLFFFQNKQKALDDSTSKKDK